MENRENNRRTFSGKVVSKSGEKSIIVEVNTYRTHKLYPKKMKKSKNFHVHDEKNEAAVGDLISFQETKPYSKTKRFRLLKIKTQTKE